MTLLRRLLYLLRKARLDREVAEEIELHRLEYREALARRGMTPDEADRQSRRAMGNVTLAREDAADAWGWRWLATLRQDLVYAARTLRRSPAFTAIATLSLAIGIGATTAIFSVVDGVLLRPLPYADPEQLVVIGRPASVAPGTFLDWRDELRSFSAMGAAEFWTPNLADSRRAEQIYALHVTPDVFATLGVAPSAGRVLDAADAHQGRDRVLVISDRFWNARFHRAPDVVGRQVVLDGNAYTVVGVMPAAFRFAPFWATRAEVWAPLVLDARRTDREGSSLRVFARLKPGVTWAAARSEVEAVATALDSRYPNTNRLIQVVPLHERVVGDVRRPLLALFVAVTLVLLIACSNVAHLQLVRSAGRVREISLRTALGASRRRVARQLFTESLVVAAIGGILGCVLATWATGWLVAWAPPTLPRIDSVRVDARMLAFAVAASAAAALIFGLAPAWRTAHVDPGAALKTGGRGSTAGAAGGRRLLIVSEIAMALVLLVGGALLLKSFKSLLDVDSGVSPHGVLVADVSPQGTAEGNPGRRIVFFDALLGRLRHTPGVVSAGAINHLPLIGDSWRLSFAIQGRPQPAGDERPGALFRVVMPGYFETMGIPIVRGRDITAGDVASAPHVVVINETLARRHFPGQDPIGQRIANDDRDPAKTDWFTIVGVVRDSVQGEWGAPRIEETFYPYAQTPLYTSSPAAFAASMGVVIRTNGDPSAAASILADAVSALNPSVAVSHVATMDGVIGEALTGPRFYMTLLTLFALVAAALALIGLYGVIADNAASRRQEIGVRMALGASRASVLRAFLKQAIVLTAAGVCAGMILATLGMRSLQPLLYGVRAYDPAVLVEVTAALLAVSACAAAIPSWRAARMDPLDALRAE